MSNYLTASEDEGSPAPASAAKADAHSSSTASERTIERSRNASLDLLRVVACAAVIVLHTSARLIYAYDDVDAISWTIANLVNSAVRWSVPVFVMLSGALLIVSPIERPRDFLLRRMLRIVPAIIVWNAAYLVWRLQYHHEPIDLATAATLFLNGEMYYHLYFLFLIAGLYMFAPALSYALPRLPERVAVGSGIGALSIACAALAIGTWQPNMFTYFVPYVGYFVLGALIVRRPRVHPALSASVFVAAVLITAGLATVSIKVFGPLQKWGLYAYEYFSPTVIPMAIAIFALFVGAAIPKRIAKVAASLAPATLGIYLIHPMILEMVRSLVGDRNLLFPWPYLDVPVVFVLVAAPSAAIVLILRRIPLLRAIL